MFTGWLRLLIATVMTSVSALPFSWNRAGFDSRGSGTNDNYPDGSITSSDDTFKFNQMITISVGISLPTAPRISE